MAAVRSTMVVAAALCLITWPGAYGSEERQDNIWGSNMLIVGRQDAGSKVAPHRIRRQDGVSDNVDFYWLHVDNVDIYWLHVESRVTSRFASVTVESKLANRADRGQEAVFTMQLPEAAFISNFTMLINGTLLVGRVMEKEAANLTYQAAVQAGQSAGHVAQQSARGRAMFRIAINVGAGEKVTFQLTYQEFLVRRLGIYEHVISIRPEQIVPDMRIGVDLRESQGFSFLRVRDIRTSDLLTEQSTDELSTAVVSRVSPDHYTIIYSPTEQEQAAMSAQGIMGDFVVQYDVIHQQQIGFVQVSDDYFVHYFAPTGLPVMPKNVIFVIDVSGSMRYEKIRQTKEAMGVILDQLREVDFFNIVTFSNQAMWWRSELQPASHGTVMAAHSYVTEMNANGGTNINEAITEAATMLTRAPDDIGRASMLVLLTDGQPTVGELNTEEIIENAQRLLVGNHTLFCLGFGYDVSFEFLEKLALRNGGFARRIYPEDDADHQLTSFFDEVAQPLMIDVSMEYGEIADVTQTAFSNYFNGSEVVVAGRFPGAPPSNFHVTVTGMGAQNALSLVEDFQVASLAAPEGFVERLWAYLTIKDLLNKERMTTDMEQGRHLKARALRMSLEYNFVTPLTSMVVVQSNALEEAPNVEAHDFMQTANIVPMLGHFGGVVTVRGHVTLIATAAVVFALVCFL